MVLGVVYVAVGLVSLIVVFLVLLVVLCDLVQFASFDWVLLYIRIGLSGY